MAENKKKKSFDEVLEEAKSGKIKADISNDKSSISKSESNKSSSETKIKTNSEAKNRRSFDDVVNDAHSGKINSVVDTNTNVESNTGRKSNPYKMTESEFNKRDSVKNKYGTYQNYLDDKVETKEPERVNSSVNPKLATRKEFEQRKSLNKKYVSYEEYLLNNEVNKNANIPNNNLNKDDVLYQKAQYNINNTYGTDTSNQLAPFTNPNSPLPETSVEDYVTQTEREKALKVTVNSQYDEKYNNASDEEKRLLLLYYDGDHGEKTPTIKKRLIEEYGYKENEIRALSDIANQERNAEEAANDERIMKDYASEHPVSASVMSWANGVVSGIPSAYGMYKDIKEARELKKSGSYYDLGIDVNNPYGTAYRDSKAIKEQVMSDHDWNINVFGKDIDMFDELYGTGMSYLESTATGLVPGGQVGFFLNAGMDEVYDLTERGASTEQAIAGGIAAGAFELIFESLSIGKLKSLAKLEKGSVVAKDSIKETVKNVALRMAEQTGVNASEETLTEIANILYDTWANGDISNYQLMMSYYQQNHYDENGNLVAGVSEEEAKKIVAKELGWQVAEAGFGGALMGLGAGAGGSAVNIGNTFARNTVGAKSTGKSIRQNNNAEAVMDVAKVMPEDSVTAKKLNEYEEKAKKKGEEISDRQLGRVYQELVDDYNDGSINEKQKKAVDQKLEEINEARKEAEAKKNQYKENGAIDKQTKMDVTNPEIEINGKTTRVYDSGEYFKGSAEGEEAKHVSVFKKKNGKLVFQVNAQSVDADVDGKAVKQIKAQDVELNEKNIKGIKDNDVRTIFEHVLKNNLSAEAANLLLENYDGEAVSMEYVNAFDTLKKQGELGSNEFAVLSHYHNEHSFFTEDNAKAIMKLGFEERKINSGLTDMRTVKQPDKIQRAITDFQLRVINDAAKKRNMEVIIVDDVVGKTKDGWAYMNGANLGDNRIVISSKADGNLLLSFFGHEQGHTIAREDAETFNLLKDKAQQLYKIDNRSWEDEINDLVERGYTQDKAEEEAVANILYRLYDRDTLEQIVAKKPKFVKGLIKIIDNIINGIEANTRLYAGRHADMKVLLNQSDEAKAILSDIKKLANESLDKIGEKYGNYVGGSHAVYEAYKTGKPFSYNGVKSKYSEEALGWLDSEYIGLTPEEFKAKLKDNLAESGIDFDEKTQSVSQSIRFTLDKTNYKAEELASMIAEVTGRSYEDAKRWVDAEQSLAAVILENPEYLDFEPDDRYEAIKNNSDYPQGTVDLSNLCPKRIEFTTMFDKLQKMYPHKMFDADAIAQMRQVLSDNNIEIACGACYVEDRRQHNGEIAAEFIEKWSEGLKNKGQITKHSGADLKVTKEMAKKYGLKKGDKLYADDSYIPTQYDLTTYEGFRRLHKDHPSIAYTFEAFNSSRGQQAGRLIEGRAEYKRQILDLTDAEVKKKNDVGGLRIFSFSDFEVAHMLDLIQIIMDCSAKGVMIQGYTKRPEFARLIRNTGIKINRSLIPTETGIKIVDGKKVLEYDLVEGINIEDENFLDEHDNDNVGNILIGVSDEQIGLAMLDDFVDYIIPFHSNKAKDILRQLGVGKWQNYKYAQAEKNASTMKRTDDVNIYTDVLGNPEYTITNKHEFVDAFLQECKKQNKIPRFSQFLNVDEHGDFSYREGYHKLIIDFKLFDKEGNILPQGLVTPDLDLDFMKSLMAKEVEKQQNYKFPQHVFDELVEKFGDEESKTNFSISDRDYFDAIEKYGEDSKEVENLVYDYFAKKFGADNIIEGWHGTMKYGFREFDKRKSGVGGNSGAGFYITTNIDDAEQNYADVEGADNYFKWSRVAEQILDDGEWDGEKVTDKERAEEIAKSLMSNGGTYHLYGITKNPYIRDFRNSTNIYDKLMEDFDESIIDRDDYENEDDYEDALYEEKSNHIYESIYNAVYDALSELEDVYGDVYFNNADELISDITMDSYDYESLTWDSILKAVQKYDIEAYNDWSEEGSLWLDVEYTRAIVEALGYDAVLDKEVSKKFNQLKNMYGGTEHLIVFKPSQLKRADGVTRDEKGNIIPLSERGNLSNDDINFSTSDRSYLKAIKQYGEDSEEVSKIVEKAAKRNGYTEHVFHGTTKGGFTIFDKKYSDDHLSFFVSSNPNMSKTYTEDGDVKKLSKFDASKISDDDIIKSLENEYGSKDKIQVIKKGDTEKLKSLSDEKIKNIIVKFRRDLREGDLASLKETSNNHHEYITSQIESYIFDVDGLVSSYLKGLTSIEELATEMDRINKSSMMYAYQIGIDARRNIYLNSCKDYITRANLYIGTISSLSELTEEGLNRVSKEDVYYIYDNRRPEIFGKSEAIDLFVEAANGIYSLYGNTNNQFVYDGEGRNWNDLKFTTPDGKVLSRTRQISAWAFDNGYHSVRIKNITDNGGLTNTGNPKGDVYIYFNPEDLKSADPVTYDEDGNIIPLSERFNKGNKDIRWSTSERNAEDRDYFGAIENGNEDKAINIIEQKAKKWGAITENGRPVVFYHGTASDFNVFDLSLAGKNFSGWGMYGKGIYLSKSKDDAYRWAKKANGKKVMPLYIKDGNYLDSSNIPESIWDKIPSKKIKDSYSNKSSLFYFNDAVDEYNKTVKNKSDKLDTTNILKEYGYDGIIGSGNDQIVVFDNTNIKSAEWVVTDDDGAIVSPSKRFTGSNDIRFSASDRNDINAVNSYYSDLITENNFYRNVQAVMGDVYSQIRNDVEVSTRSVHAVANRILKNSNSKLDVEALTDDLLVAYDYMVNSGKNGTYNQDDLMRFINKISQNIVENSSGLDWSTYYEHKPARDLLSGNTIYVDEHDRKEIEYTYGSFASWKYIMSYLNNKVITDLADRKGSYTTLDSLGNEAVANFPGEFGEPGDPYSYNENGTSIHYDSFAVQFADFIENKARLKKHQGTKYWENVRQVSVEDAINLTTVEILKEFANVKQFIAPEQKVLNQAYDLKRKYDKKEKELGLSYKRREEEIMRNWESDIRDLNAGFEMFKIELENEANKSIKDKMKDYTERQETKERRRVLKNKAERSLRYLNTRLTNPDRTRHIPEGQRNLVDALLKAIPIGNGGRFSREKLGNLMAEYDKAMKNYAYLLGEESREQAGIKIKDDIEYIQNKLCEDKATGQPGARVRDLTRDDIEVINDVVEHVKFLVDTENKLFADNRRDSLNLTGVDALLGLNKKQSKDQGGQGIKNKAIHNMALFKAGITKPEYLMKNTSPALYDLYKKIRQGENTEAKLLREAQSRLQQIKKDVDYDPVWRDHKNKIVLENNLELGITDEGAMYVYALSKRNQGMQHLVGENGGVTIVDEFTGKRKTFRLNENDVNTIIDSLTDKQKRYVDNVMDYLSEDIAAQRNAVSKTLYGIELYKEKNYVPIQVDKTTVDTNIARPEKMSGIANQGSSKQLNKKATNPIQVSGFSDVINKHIYDSVLYCSYAVNVENLKRVFNFRNENGSVHSALKDVVGIAGLQQINKLFTDIDSGQMQGDMMPLNAKMMSRAKKAAVMANMSVIVQQPTAVFRAMLYIDPKYFVTVAKKSDIEEMYEWNGCAVKKQIGYFDVNMGKSAIDFIDEYTPSKEVKKNWDGKDKFKQAHVMQKIDDIASIGANKADEITWGAIWNACKKQIAEQNPELEGDAMLQKASELFQDTIANTQVYDSVFTKPEYMRSKEGFKVLATAFMSEPLTSFNMLADSVQKARTSKSSQASKTCVRAFACYAASLISNAAIKSLVYAMRDDDDDKSFWEKYIGRIPGSMADDIFGLVPYMSDIINTFEGWDVSRMDMTWLSTIGDLVKMLQKDNIDTEKLIKTLMQAGSQMTGVAGYNAYRDVVALTKASIELYNNIRYTMSDGKFGKKAEPTTARGVLESVKDNLPFIETMDMGERMYQDIINGNIDDYSKVYNNMIEASTSKSAENSADNKVASALAKDERIADVYNAIADGDMDKRDAVYDELIAQGFNRNTVNKAVKDYENNLVDIVSSDPRTKEAAEARYNMDYQKYMLLQAELTKTYPDYNEEIVNKAITKELPDLNKSKKDFEAEDEEALKKSYDVYNAIYNGTRDDVANLYSTMLKNGVSEEAANKQVYEVARSSYKSGDLSETDYEFYATKYGGKSEDDLFWDEQAANAGEGFKKYDRWVNAVKNNSLTDEDISYYLEHGVKKETLYSNTDIKAGVLDGSIDPDVVIKAYVKLGYDYKKAYNKVYKTWLKNKK